MTDENDWQPQSLGFAFDMAFQPVFDLRTGDVFAYEALVRGEQGEPASSILKFVNDNNCTRFDDQVRIMAIKKAASMGLCESGASLTINFRPKSTTDALRCLCDTVTLVDRVGLERKRIIFEFSEGVRLDVADIRTIVLAYKSYGFCTALDDFGAGYAGLVTLANLKTDYVKLDMDLIRGIDSSHARRTIVTSLVAMLTNLGRKVVAEGVETAGELEVLQQIGVDLIQGFYLGRPSRWELQETSYPMAAAA